MGFKARGIGAVAAAGAIAALWAAPASAAEGPSLTAQTDAGTSCTISSQYAVGSGLLGLSPIDFSGDIACSPADPAKAVISQAGLRLTSSLLGLGDVLPLGIGQIGGAGGRPNSPPNTDQPPPEEAPPACRLDPGYDCGYTGRANGLPGTTYQLVFGVALIAPEGETWTTAPEGCEIPEPQTVTCVSLGEPFATS